MQSHTRRSFLQTVAQSSAEEGASWLHINRKAMACRFEVTLPPSEPAGVAMATEALDEVDRLEAQLTVFRESSEVSHVNKWAAAGPVGLSQSLFDLLSLCKDLYQATEGAFDITSGPLTRCWGFLRRAGRMPNESEVHQAKALVGSDKLLLDAEARTIHFTQAGVEINLGSIGKGYALDCATSVIGNELRSALLSAGSSSIRAIGIGTPGQRAWVVGLRDPQTPSRRLGVLRIRDCAMSTSGSEEQFFEHEGKRYGHIIDPRSGWPASTVTSVTVVAGSAAISDALATAFYVGGRELAERFCGSHSEVLAILLEREATTPIVIGSNSRCEGPTDL